jgi:hypothetical protein
MALAVTGIGELGATRRSWFESPHPAKRQVVTITATEAINLVHIIVRRKRVE